MSILFVLLTFLLILSIMYFRRPEAPALVVQPASFQKIAVPKMLRMADVQVPQEYAFHPCHTWVHDEGHQNARVGVDAFASDLFGQIDAVEVTELNRWVRQGQRLCTLKHGQDTVDLLSPVEGVVISLNHEVLKKLQPDHQRSLSQWLGLRRKGARAFDQYQEPLAGVHCFGMDREQSCTCPWNHAATQPRFGP